MSPRSMWAAAWGPRCPGLTWQSFGWPAAVAMTLAMLTLMALVVALGWREPEARV